MKRVDEKLTRRACAALFVYVVSAIHKQTLWKRRGTRVLLSFTALSPARLAGQFSLPNRRSPTQNVRSWSNNLSFLFSTWVPSSESSGERALIRNAF